MKISKKKKRSRNGFPGLPAPGVKWSEKSSKRVEKVSKESVLSQFLTFFLTCLPPRTPPAPGTHFETFFELFHIQAELPLWMANGIPSFRLSFLILWGWGVVPAPSSLILALRSTSQVTHLLMGEALLLTVGAFLLTVKLLCLQSLKALIRRTASHCKQKSSNCK